MRIRREKRLSGTILSDLTRGDTVDGTRMSVRLQNGILKGVDLKLGSVRCIRVLMGFMWSGPWTYGLPPNSIPHDIYSIYLRDIYTTRHSLERQLYCMTVSHFSLLRHKDLSIHCNSRLLIQAREDAYNQFMRKSNDTVLALCIPSINLSLDISTDETYPLTRTK